MKQMRNFLFALFTIALTSPGVTAQDFVYEPKNPAFGGETFNYQWMLSSAQAQNSIEGGSGTGFSRDPLADFEENLNRQILNQLSRQIVTSQFGEDSLQEGSYILGNYQIEISSGADGVHIIISDTGTGSQSTVLIPYF